MMTQKDKELLLKDLCARLPYGVKVQAKFIDADANTKVEKNGTLSMICNDASVAFTCDDTNGFTYVAIHEAKPYLFPLSSMTKEQEDEWYDVCLQPLIKRLDQHTRKEDLMLYAESQYAGSDWLNKNHFDYRGLIPKGLANDATGLNIY